jgi:hypothetical protein
MWTHFLISFGGLRSALRALETKMPHSGLGNEAKSPFSELHVPREPGGNWHLATSEELWSGCRGVVGPVIPQPLCMKIASRL